MTDNIHASDPDTPRWYALKVFYNRVFALRDRLAPSVAESYVPLRSEVVVRDGKRQKMTRPLVSSLLFVSVRPDRACELQPLVEGEAMVYTRHTASGLEPAPIPDREMELFKFITSGGHEGVEYLGDDCPRYHKGDLVRVIDGPFKGAEGHIVRIKDNRRLIVSIKGVCAVATGFIPGAFLERIPSQ